MVSHSSLAKAIQNCPWLEMRPKELPHACVQSLFGPKFKDMRGNDKDRKNEKNMTDSSAEVKRFFSAHSLRGATVSCKRFQTSQGLCHPLPAILSEVSPLGMSYIPSCFLDYRNRNPVTTIWEHRVQYPERYGMCVQACLVQSKSFGSFRVVIFASSSVQTASDLASLTSLRSWNCPWSHPADIATILHQSSSAENAVAARSSQRLFMAKCQRGRGQGGRVTWAKTVLHTNATKNCHQDRVAGKTTCGPIDISPVWILCDFNSLTSHVVLATGTYHFDSTCFFSMADDTVLLAVSSLFVANTLL